MDGRGKRTVIQKAVKKSRVNRHLPKIEVRHMRKASDPKATPALDSFVVIEGTLE